MTGEQLPLRADIEAALQRVQSGELSPAEATQWLLADISDVSRDDQDGAKMSKSVDEETLASLIDRLGTPPDDVIEVWCEQLTVAASVHEQERGQALPTIVLRDWTINNRGELLCNGQSIADRATITQPVTITDESREQINLFRQALTGEPTPLTLPETTDPTVTANDANEDVPLIDPGDPVRSPAENPDRASITRRASRSRPHKLLIGAAALGALALIAVILFIASRPKTEVAGEPTPASDMARAADRVVEVESTDRPSTDSVTKKEPSGDALETFESAAATSGGPSNPADALLTLDALIPDSGFLKPPEVLDSMPESDGRLATDVGSTPADQQATEPTAGESDIASSMDAPIDESDADTPEESPQATRASTVTAVQLPPSDDVSTLQQLWDRAAGSLTLAFPTELPIELREGDSAWQIFDTRKTIAIANVTKDANATRLAWSPDAAESSIAGSLVHGQLTDDTDSVIYLRPMIEAEPWPIQLEQSDVRPTWDLLFPIPPRVSRLTIDFDLPEEIEEGWIEPIDATALRRTRGLAVLTPKNEETVALGMRFDVRCGRKLSVRVRYAARLAPTMPWQNVSNAGLLRFADQLTEQASLNSRQSTQMAALYDRADTNERRILRPKRDQLEVQADTLRVASQRVAELQAMIDALETDGLLRLRVWVVWPDSEQTLLATPSRTDVVQRDDADAEE